MKERSTAIAGRAIERVKYASSLIFPLFFCRAPVVVGQMLMSGRDMYDSNMKGKGIRVLHYFGDELW